MVNYNELADKAAEKKNESLNEAIGGAIHAIDEVVDSKNRHHEKVLFFGGVANLAEAFLENGIDGISRVLSGQAATPQQSIPAQKAVEDAVVYHDQAEVDRLVAEREKALKDLKHLQSLFKEAQKDHENAVQVLQATLPRGTYTVDANGSIDPKATVSAVRTARRNEKANDGAAVTADQFEALQRELSSEKNKLAASEAAKADVDLRLTKETQKVKTLETKVDELETKAREFETKTKVFDTQAVELETKTKELQAFSQKLNKVRSSVGRLADNTKVAHFDAVKSSVASARSFFREMDGLFEGGTTFTDTVFAKK